METLQKTENGHRFTYNGHPSQFPNHIIEKHKSMPSMARRRIFDCRDSKIKEQPFFSSCGNLSTYGIINGLEVKILPYGRNIKEAIENIKED